MEDIVYLTTADNPWSPFTNWDEWLSYDIAMGYNTCARLSILAPTSDSLPDVVNKRILNDAMDQLVELGAYNKNGEFVQYKKVKE